MAREFNPFAKKETSKVVTPWGDYEVAQPNKARLALMEDLQKEAERLQETDSTLLEENVQIAMRSAAAGLDRGDELLAEMQKAWDAGDITLANIRELAEFVGEELFGAVNEGNG